MRKDYDFTNARPNPYVKRLKRSVTIRLDEGTIAYFKQLAAATELPYQSLINLYLRDCAATKRRPRPGGRFHRTAAATGRSQTPRRCAARCFHRVAQTGHDAT